MVTFLYSGGDGDRRARMYFNPAFSEGEAVLQWGQYRFQSVASGEVAMEFLAGQWKCPPDKIIHNMPDRIETPQQEQTFAMFYNGCPFAIPNRDRHYKLVWAGWKSSPAGQLEPVWRNIVEEVTFPDHPEYSQAACRRIMGSGLALVCDKIEQDGQPTIKVHFRCNPHIKLRVCEGIWTTERFRVRHMIPDLSVGRIIPDPRDVEAALRIITEEKNRAIETMLSGIYPSTSDVVEVRDFPHSILYGVKPLPRASQAAHDIAWISDNGRTAYLVRIGINGEIRCPDTLKGKLIGRKGAKIREIAAKHGYKYLNVV